MCCVLLLNCYINLSTGENNYDLNDIVHITYLKLIVEAHRDTDQCI